MENRPGSLRAEYNCRPSPDGLSHPLDVLSRIEASLLAGGFKITRDSVSGRRAVIGRSRRRLFVLVAVFKAGMASRQQLDRFLDEAGQYAATVKGGLGSASAVAVAVVEAGGHDEPGDWAMRPPAGRAMAFPALVDLAAGRVTCPGTPADLHRLVQAHVAPSIHMV